MCKFQTRNNTMCKIASKDNEYCHIHRKIIATQKLNSFDLKLSQSKNEIRNLNKTIQRKTKFFRNEIVKKEETIENLKDQIEDLRDSISSHIKTINMMKEDYDKYQLIKAYELKKKKLLENGIDIFKYNDQEFHYQRKLRNKLAHEVESF